MSGPPGYHGWTHRPKAMGGTDPIPVSLSPFPAVVCSGNGHTIKDIDDPSGTNRYAMTILDAEFYGSYEGMMDTITVYNDPADGSLAFSMGGTPASRLRIHNGVYNVRVEAGMVVSSGEWPGDVVMIAEGPSLADDLPVVNAHTILVPDTNLWTSAHTNVIARGAIDVVVQGGDFTDLPDSDFLTVEVMNDSGASLTLAQFWCYIVAMPLNDPVTFT